MRRRLREPEPVERPLIIPLTGQGNRILTWQLFSLSPLAGAACGESRPFHKLEVVERPPGMSAKTRPFRPLPASGER